MKGMHINFNFNIKEKFILKIKFQTFFHKCIEIQINFLYFQISGEEQVGFGWCITLLMQDSKIAVFVMSIGLTLGMVTPTGLFNVKKIYSIFLCIREKMLFKLESLLAIYVGGRGGGLCSFPRSIFRHYIVKKEKKQKNC